MEVGEFFTMVVRFFWFLAWVFLVIAISYLIQELNRPGDAAPDEVIAFLMIILCLAIIYAAW